MVDTVRLTESVVGQCCWPISGTGPARSLLKQQSWSKPPNDLMVVEKMLRQISSWVTSIITCNQKRHPSKRRLAGKLLLRVCPLSCAIVLCTCHVLVAQEVPLDANVLDGRTLSLIKTHCGSCHGEDSPEGDINFEQMKTIGQARDKIDVWLKVRSVLESRQMPPPEAVQPDDTDRKRLISWTNLFLKAEAAASAGDPGPVPLRRLSNAEYEYALRDLTGLSSLNPTQGFPIDGAAGEGFTNVGSGQAMSPSLFQKYLDSAKLVAEHLVLLPTGIEFSPSTTQRDRTNEKLSEIQAFYRRYTTDGGGTAVDLHGIKFQTNQGGMLPIRKYLHALLESREALQQGNTTLVRVALKHRLNSRYLSTIWSMLATPESDSFLVRQFQKSFQQATADNVEPLLSKVKKAQDEFWKFNSIGHIGRQGGPQRWMEPVVPVVGEQELRLPLAGADDGNEIQVTLTAHDLGDGDVHDYVLWREPRLLMKSDSGGSPTTIMLKDVKSLSAKVRSLQQSELKQTSRYLAQMLKIMDEPESAHPTKEEELDPSGFNRDLLANWFAVAGLKHPDTRRISGLFTQPLSKVQGYDAINGWGSLDTPSILANRSNKSISFLTLTIPPRSIVVHPSPTSAAEVAWKSPVSGSLEVSCSVADADNKCGNGAGWRIEQRSRWGTRLVAQGIIENGGHDSWTGMQTLNLAKGDVIALLILPRDNNHSCDTTHVDLKLVEQQGEQRTWSLRDQVVGRVHEGNPMADTFGHEDVWNFGQSNPEQGLQIPDGSALAAWREQAILWKANPDEGKQNDLVELAAAVQRVVTTNEQETLSAADQELRRQVLDWRGPLQWLSLGKSSLKQTETQQPDDGNALPFGTHPDGVDLQREDLCTRGTSTINIAIPAELKASEFVTTAKMHGTSGVQGTVQVQAHANAVEKPELDFGGTFLVHPDGSTGEQIRSSVRSFGAVFPPALCYSRIVPVDEVVTLRLFHREDDCLSRLMLTSEEQSELDRLWDEMLFVSDEPLKLAVSFEQISEFATQDRPDLVIAFEPLRAPINRRAEEFRKRKITSEPLQLQKVMQFAELAWRHQLETSSRQQLLDFYHLLRREGMQHSRALQALLARILTAPEFLYKLESPSLGNGQSDVEGEALASRLSFFLWSSIPDQQLLDLGRGGKLQDRKVMAQQVSRMLQDPRAKRLAPQFACQWLHVRDFDQNDDKNEKLYPEFATLRRSMYGETIRFFEDMFQNNGSLRDLVDADHTFLDQPLAKHYGLDWDATQDNDVEGPDQATWRRFEGMRSKGRGGVLGMATVLSSQSGASRTSPILRGNWVYETLLGEQLPKPPAAVPVLPEQLPDGLTSRQLIEKHSTEAACAKCHAHIDPFGFALEGYDAMGARRDTDVDTNATLFDGKVIRGVRELRQYLREDRMDDVVRQFCRKLLGFALGRQVLLSDEPLLNEIQKTLATGDFRVEIAIRAIINSPQFLQIRDQQSDVQP